MSDGRRTIPRSNAFTFGLLRFDSRAEPVECMIWDISPEGAMIEVADMDTVPDIVSLAVPPDGPLRSATVIWRVGRRLGLSF